MKPTFRNSLSKQFIHRKSNSVGSIVEEIQSLKESSRNYGNDYYLPDVTKVSLHPPCPPSRHGSYSADEWTNIIQNELEPSEWAMLRSKEEEEVLEISHENNEIYTIRSSPSPQLFSYSMNDLCSFVKDETDTLVVPPNKPKRILRETFDSTSNNEQLKMINSEESDTEKSCDLPAKKNEINSYEFGNKADAVGKENTLLEENKLSKIQNVGEATIKEHDSKEIQLQNCNRSTAEEKITQLLDECVELLGSSDELFDSDIGDNKSDLTFNESSCLNNDTKLLLGPDETLSLMDAVEVENKSVVENHLISNSNEILENNLSEPFVKVVTGTDEIEEIKVKENGSDTLDIGNESKLLKSTDLNLNVTNVPTIVNFVHKASVPFEATDTIRNVFHTKADRTILSNKPEFGDVIEELSNTFKKKAEKDLEMHTCKISEVSNDFKGSITASLKSENFDLLPKLEVGKDLEIHTCKISEESNDIKGLITDSFKSETLEMLPKIENLVEKEVVPIKQNLKIDENSLTTNNHLTVTKPYFSQRSNNLMGPKPYHVFLESYSLRQEQQKKQMREKYGVDSSFKLALNSSCLGESCKSSESPKEHNSSSLIKSFLGFTETETPAAEPNNTLSHSMLELINHSLKNEEISLNSINKTLHLLEDDHIVHFPTNNTLTEENLEESRIEEGLKSIPTDKLELLKISREESVANDKHLAEENTIILGDDIQLPTEQVKEDLELFCESKLELKLAKQVETSIYPEVSNFDQSYEESSDESDSPLVYCVNSATSKTDVCPTHLQIVSSKINQIVPNVVVTPCLKSQWHSESVTTVSHGLDDDGLDSSDLWLRQMYHQELQEMPLSQKVWSHPSAKKKVRFLDAVEQIPTNGCSSDLDCSSSDEESDVYNGVECASGSCIEKSRETAKEDDKLMDSARREAPQIDVKLHNPVVKDELATRWRTTFLLEI